MRLREQELDEAHLHDGDRGGDLALREHLGLLSVEVEPALPFDDRRCQSASHLIASVEKKCDDIVRVGAGLDRLAEGDGDQVEVGPRKVETFGHRFGLRRGGHRGHRLLRAGTAENELRQAAARGFCGVFADTIRFVTPKYTLDDEPATLDDLLADNAADGVVPFTAEEVEALRDLGPGQTMKLGDGGAGGWVELRRID